MNNTSFSWSSTYSLYLQVTLLMMASPERATNLPLPVESRLSPSSSKNDRESRNSSPKIRDRVKNSSEKGSSKKDWDEKGTETKKRKLDSEDSSKKICLIFLELPSHLFTCNFTNYRR